ncbi:DUF3016 domain-containing protein [Shewanella sedimentimangrovi]|uniref:DUF3016 domain-containing protein n=1 Tax=Shewanella sedimentimangrovi TaxID=2814293 RepID=A0ABX7QZU1_9GAMM|nr:DUF3016 domain-containing protein [Shewanella sedimentimangrovi]QSX36769.1 DUF3016 domain-containing protein [Shewanella sedimentimangrovi]
MRKLMTLVAGCMLAGAAVAADEAMENPVTEQGIVKITWQEPKKFRDIESSGELQSRFEQRLFETLTKELDKSAQKRFKPEQKLELTVTDLDMAGDMRPTFGATTTDLRIVKEVYPPRISFSYRLLDKDQVIAAGDEKLINMNFMNDIRNYNDRPFMHEVRLLTQWVSKDLVLPE